LKILVLTKRQYMGKDLLDDHFGRFRELPLELARLGHDVRGLCFSYHAKSEGKFVDRDGSSGAQVNWDSVNLFGRGLPRLKSYTTYARQLSREFQPDLIWACSDAYHAIFGSWLAKRVGARCVIDLYDNFESFSASRFPGVLPLFRRAVRAADGVTSFSQRLAEYVVQTYTRTKPTSIIENGARKDLFYPQDRNECRRQLGLPENVIVIGTAGALHSSRGIETLFKAFEQLSAEIGNIHLALAGPREHRMRIPMGPRVHDFKEISHENVPAFVNALDVAVVCYRSSLQGEFSFPQKAYEIIACRVPVVAAAVGSMNELFKDYRECLYEPENTASLADAVRRQLRQRTFIATPIPSWADSASRLQNFISEVLDSNSARAIRPSATYPSG
jgi:teichuronic acid biosynthesis glycosyltransferase TuaC